MDYTPKHVRRWARKWNPDMSEARLLDLCKAISPWFTYPDRDTTDLSDAAEIDLSLFPWYNAVEAWNRGKRKQLTAMLAAGDPPAEIADYVASRRPPGKRGPPRKNVHETLAMLALMRIEYDHYQSVLGLSADDACDVVSCRWDIHPGLLANHVKHISGNARRLKR